MARHPRIEACMFCGTFPCECEQPAKKVTPRKKKAAAPKVEQAIVEPESKPVEDFAPEEKKPAFDVRAAMKAAAADPKDEGPVVSTWNGWTLTSDGSRPLSPAQIECNDEELVEAVMNLECILHPKEIRRFRHIFNMPIVRAKKWRDRNGRRDVL